MFKLRSISKTEFDNYVTKNELKTHFMHSSVWGEFEKVTKNLTPYYLGLIDENNKITAATLLLEEHLPLNRCNLYAPRGFIIDHKNKKILNIFTEKLKIFAKRKKATSIRINPPIEYKTYDEKNYETINSSAENILVNLKNLGYKKKANIKLLEYNYKIDLTKAEQSFSKSIKNKFEQTKHYILDITIGNEKNLDEIFSSTKEKEYYETLYDIFSNNENTKIKLFIGNLHITKTLKALEREQKKIINQISIIPIDNLDDISKEKLIKLRKEKEKVTKDIEKFKDYKIKYGNFLTISATLFMEHNKEAWVLAEKNNSILTETNLSYNIYYEYIKYYQEKGYAILNQLSPINHNPTNNSFKNEFGGKFTEYIGEFDLITNKFFYILETKILPRLKKED